MIWAMIDWRSMTSAEIDAAFQEAIASRRSQPRRQALSYLMDGRPGLGVIAMAGIPPPSTFAPWFRSS